MSTDDISVLVCDDSALMRNLIGRIIDNAEGLSLAGKAMNGRFALEKIPKLKPDIIVLDLEMPEMNGIEFLKERKRLGMEIPVVILSSVAKKGAVVTMEALALGASDFIMKPSDTNTLDLGDIADSIVKTLIAYGKKHKGADRVLPKSKIEYSRPATIIEDERPTESKRTLTIPKPATFAEVNPHRQETEKVDVVVIGISTGGPNALREVFKDIDAGLKVPVLVVQHMPAGFTEEFARSLDRICPLEVKEAVDGDLLKPGRILIAPGSAHIKIERKRLAVVVRLAETEPVNGHRPSADVLFASTAEAFGGNALAVIMTGMGKDGAKEIGTLYNLGAVTIGQDEQSSIVYGMPKVAYDAGYVQYQLPLQQIAGKISSIVQEKA